MFSSMPPRRRWQAVLILLLIALVAVAGIAIPGPSVPAGGALAPVGSDPDSQGIAASTIDTSVPDVPVRLAGAQVIRSSKNDVSAPIRSLKPVARPPQEMDREYENPSLPVRNLIGLPDPVIQSSMGLGKMPSPTVTFEGIDQPVANCNCLPPDTNGDVSRIQYVQTVNLSFQVWDKQGHSLYGPAAINTIWQGFGGPCETHNDGDPVVLYDSIADRWLISQFTTASPYNECIAVSQTNDATGAWYRYAFQVSTTSLADYPKLAVWPDGYYMTANMFQGGATYKGPQPFVFNRAAMLNGQPATMQTFAPLGATHSSQLPADLDGSTLPPAGSPNYLVEFGNPLKFYKFHVDWTTPANSTFTNYASVAVASFRQLCPTTRNCLPQPGTRAKLDALGDRLMHRLVYRNFGDHETLLANHTVNAAAKAGVRWYEFRNLSTTPTVYQQSTYAPDATSRWLGSLAMDKRGDMAIGYSAASTSIYPSIRWAGRLASDPLGQLAQGEATVIAGSGSQTSSYSRWGDYSAMLIDPADDCTFWYTTEYYQATSDHAWRTRIGSFKFPSCQ